MSYNDLDYVNTFRKTEKEINPLILRRWSPRALSGEIVSQEELEGLFEAAKWAPSAFNGQPWRFLYAFNASDNWPIFFNLLTEFNQEWVKKAGALLVVLSQNNFEHNGRPNQTHSFDVGAAWENLAIEASSRGLVAHAMSGFDFDQARLILKIPDNYSVEAMVAIGKPGQKKDLPLNLQEREYPSDRKKISEIAKEGIFSF